MQKRIDSFRYAFNGLKVLIKTQVNFRIHIIVAIAVVMFGIALQIHPMEWVCIVLAMGFVIVCEAFNTSIEFVCDSITKEKNAEIGMAKDVGAGAVLISAITSVVVGLVVFVPKLTLMFHI